MMSTASQQLLRRSVWRAASDNLTPGKCGDMFIICCHPLLPLQSEQDEAHVQHSAGI